MVHPIWPRCARGLPAYTPAGEEVQEAGEEVQDARGAGGGGTVECRLAEIDSRWGVTHFRHNLLLNHYINTVMHHAVPG